MDGFALEGVSHYSVFSFSLVRDWENRVVTWLVNMWCCMIGEPVPLGLCCDALPQLSELFRSSTGVGSLEVKTVVLSDVSRTIVDDSRQVLGGTDIHVVLNHLQKRLRGFVKDPCYWDALIICKYALCWVVFLGFEIKLLIFRACVVLW